MYKLKIISFLRRTLKDYEVVGNAPVPASWVYKRKSKEVTLK